MQILTLITALPGAVAQESDLGNYGNRCLYHFPYS